MRILEISHESVIIEFDSKKEIEEYLLRSMSNISNDEKISDQNISFSQLMKLEKEFEKARSFVSENTIEDTEYLVSFHPAIQYFQDSNISSEEKRFFRQIVRDFLENPHPILNIREVDSDNDGDPFPKLREVVRDTVDRRLTKLNDVSINLSNILDRITVAEEKISTANFSIEKISESAKSALNEMQDEHEKALNALTVAFRTELSTSIAEEYWRKKGDEHKTASWVYLGILVLLILISAIGFPYFVVFLASSLNIELTQFSAGLIVVVGMPLLAILWVLRISANLYRSNRERADDADERVAMLHTFISLSSRGMAKEEERAIVLQALFRPFARSPEETLPNPAWEAMIKRIESGSKQSN